MLYEVITGSVENIDDWLAGKAVAAGAARVEIVLHSSDPEVGVEVRRAVRDRDAARNNFV